MERSCRAAHLSCPAGRGVGREPQRRDAGWRGDRRHGHRCVGCRVRRRNPNRRRRGQARRGDRLGSPRLRETIWSPARGSPARRRAPAFAGASPVIGVKSPVIGVRSPVVGMRRSHVLWVRRSPVVGVTTPVFWKRRPVVGMRPPARWRWSSWPPAGWRRPSRTPPSRRWWPPSSGRRRAPPSGRRWPPFIGRRRPSIRRRRPPATRRRRTPTRWTHVEWKSVFTRRSHGGSAPRRSLSSSHSLPDTELPELRHGGS